MAIYAGSGSVITGQTTNVTPDAFNLLFSYNFMPSVVKRNALWYLLLGKQFRGKDGLPAFERLRTDVMGDQIEVRVMGSLDDPAYIASGSAEVATATPTYNATRFGGFKMPWTHVFDNVAIPNSEMTKIQGDPAKTHSFIEDVVKGVGYGLENKMGNAINTNAAGSTEILMGTWLHAVSDGTSTGETAFATYGFDRTDSANQPWWQSYVNPAGGVLTLSKIRTAKLAAAEGQGTQTGSGPVFGIAGRTVYGIIQSIADAYTWTENDEDWGVVGSEWVGIGHTRYIFEQRAPSGVMGLIDPTAFQLFMKPAPITRQGVQPAPWLKASHILAWDCFLQLICTAPSRCAKITNITG